MSVLFRECDPSLNNLGGRLAATLASSAHLLLIVRIIKQSRAYSKTPILLFGENSPLMG